jgi:hypothetical protein
LEYNSDCNNCPASGTMALDMANVTNPAGGVSRPKVKLVRKSMEDSNASIEELASSEFVLYFRDPFYGLESRVLNLVNLTSVSYNIYNSKTASRYSDEGFEEVSDQVFRGGSNIRVSNTQVDINTLEEGLFDDDDGVIMLDLDVADPSGTNMDINRARISWMLKVYDQLYPVKNVDARGTGAFALEAYYYNLYDFGFPEPYKYMTREDAIKQFYYWGIKNPFGQTFPASPPYFICAITFRNHDYSKYFNNQPVSLERQNSYALATYLHEMGHIWSLKGEKIGDADDCVLHTYYCSGYSEDICLFQTACKSNDEFPTYLQKKAELPRFCERHFYIFMNNFALRDERL